MNTQVKKDLRFTGGDKLSDLQKIYHEIMMVNELYNGMGAYQVTFAGGESGISFGGNQVDMKEQKKYIPVFVDILKHATDNQGNHFFTSSEVANIVGKNNEKLIKSPNSLEDFFGPYLDKVNAALSSEYGRAKIDAVYLVEMQENADHIDRAIAAITNPAAKEFYSSGIGKLLLFDYHNQYGLELNGRLYDYLDGKGKANYLTGDILHAPTDVYTIDDHIKYIHSTEQYKNNPKNCDNRIANVQAVFAKYIDFFTNDHGEASQFDFAFTYDKGELKWKIFPGVEMPSIPNAQGSQNFLFLGNYKYFYYPIGTPPDIDFKGNYYYYSADEKALYYVQSQVAGAPSNPIPLLGNQRLWQPVAIGLSPHKNKTKMEFPGNINLQNYDYINIQKRIGVQLKDVFAWLNDVIIFGTPIDSSVITQNIPPSKHSIFEAKKSLFHEMLPSKSKLVSDIDEHQQPFDNDDSNNNISNEFSLYINELVEHDVTSSPVTSDTIPEITTQNAPVLTTPDAHQISVTPQYQEVIKLEEVISTANSDEIQVLQEINQENRDEDLNNQMNVAFEQTLTQGVDSVVEKSTDSSPIAQIEEAENANPAIEQAPPAQRHTIEIVELNTLHENIHFMA